MKKRLFMACMLICAAVHVMAESSFGMAPLKLELAPMNPLAEAAISQPLDYEAVETEPSVVINTDMSMPVDLDFFKQKTNTGVKPYKIMDDLTFVGVPIFVAGILAKPEKKSFRQNLEGGNAKTMLLTNFKTRIDDYTQFFGPAMTVGLKLGGYEGRSDWPRLAANAAMSYGFMALFVNGIKYTAKEMRPDGSTANSWPSGHTATSFVGATMLHKEYGLTRSPWFSVAGYGVATATGVMRVLNNRHWVSDVLSGAGIGIMSTELGYALGDILFKGRGLLRGDLQNTSNNPSFFAISMGLGLGTNSMTFTTADFKYADQEPWEGADEEDPLDVNFHTATTVDAEGAYFFNKYFGVGGRLRVRAMTAKNWNTYVDGAYEDVFTSVMLMSELRKYSLGLDDEMSLPASEQNALASMVDDMEATVESDHLTEFSGSVGLYLNLPLGKHFDLGTKFLIGRSITQELDINAKVKGKEANLDYQVTLKNGSVDENSTVIGTISSTGKDYEVSDWDFLTMGANNNTTYGTGISLTYKYKSNFSWRVFADYDYSDKTFTLSYDPYRFLRTAMPNGAKFLQAYGVNLNAMEFVKKKKTHFYTIGASFAVNF